MSTSRLRFKYLAVITMIVAILLGSISPNGSTRAQAVKDMSRQAGGADSSATYTAQSVSLRADTRLGAFPYGVYGLDETDREPIFTYKYTQGYRSPAGDIDPVTLMSAMKSDGVYNVVLSSKLGGIKVEDKIIRTLSAAKSKNLHLIVRVLAWNSNFTVNVAETQARLARYQRVFARRSDLRSVIYAWYSYDEPMNKLPQSLRLSEVRKAYQLHKKYFPATPVFTVYNQNQNIAGSLLGQYRNPYGSGTGDIIGLNIYPVGGTSSGPSYGTRAIRRLYTHARKVIGPNKRIFAVAQAHGLAGNPDSVPTPSLLAAQADDWFRAGPDAGLRPIDGLLWYSWHFPPTSAQRSSDLEGNAANRRMAKQIGLRTKDKSW